MSREIVGKAAFLTGFTRQKEDVALPELGEGVVMPVWGMTAREKSEWEKGFISSKGKPIEQRVRETRERLIVACCRNDDGSYIFTDEDIPQIGQMAATAVERIVTTAQRLSGMSDTDVEDAAKN